MQKNIFISYSWDSKEHQDWVLKLSNELDSYEEINVKLDQYDLDTSSNKNHFMESSAFDSDLVLIIMTPGYVKKADNRAGGAGIETYLLTTRYWEEMLENKKTTLVPILREGDFSEVPRYLKGNFCVDFRNNDSFEKKLSELLKIIQGSNLAKRPEKTKTLTPIIKNTNFTRCEDIIKIIHKKRKLVFKKEDTTNYSGKNKIKFELWETFLPNSNHYLFLFENINIKETIEHLSYLLKRDGIKITHLTILRNKKGDTGYLERLLKAHAINAIVNEHTFSEYIWNFCIDDDVKEQEDIFQNPLFIDQDIIKYDTEEDGEITTSNLGPASEKIFDILKDESQSSIKIITAPGGTGKTTLCHNLSKRLFNDTQTVPILIQAESIRSIANEASRSNLSIESVFDLYDAYYKLSNNQSERSKFSDRNTFEMALLTGKLVMIIDGMDEFISLFHQRFNVVNFFQSVFDLNEQLGQSKIIITTRNDVFNEKLLSEDSRIEKFKLLGFDKQTCDKYLMRRFRKYPEPDTLCLQVYDLIKPINEFSKNEDRILPFIIDLFSTQLEDSDTPSGAITFSSFKAEKDYDSNDEVIDYLVFSVIKRELIRQNINLKIRDIVNFFMEISSYPSKKYSLTEIEDYFELEHNDSKKRIASKILINPLLDAVSAEDYSLKYDFLLPYFKSLYLIKNILNKSQSNNFYRILAQNSFGDTEIFSEAAKFFRDREANFISNSQGICSNLINLKKDAGQETSQQSKKSIGFLINILSSLPSCRTSKSTFTEKLKEMLCYTNKIENIGIYGLKAPIDFSDTIILKSNFVQYFGLAKSTFNNTKFSYCDFENTPMDTVPSSLSDELFENCILGDLEKAIEQRKIESINNAETTNEEIRKFLSSFFHNGKFRDQKIDYVKMSDKVKGINSDFFTRLIKSNVIVLKVKKTSDNYYVIAENYKDSVYKFITNGAINVQIQEIVELIR